MPRIWAIVPIDLPLINRPCHGCASTQLRATGKFRVNAHHKRLDAWLLALCQACGQTAKLTVLQRVPVHSVPPGLLDKLHGNDGALVAQALQDPAFLRRNRATLDWRGAWRLDTGGAHHLDNDVIDVVVRFTTPIPIRPVRLIADGFGVSRAVVARWIDHEILTSSARLTRTLSSSFAFTLVPEHRWMPDGSA